ncbi:hypothetical protein HYZ64_02490 [Candidatus Berkelbacteria bacterium]|nr:hypothetical protein [Candidatus Berkelbacteria bacterium]
MSSLVTLLQTWLQPVPEALRPYVFFGIAIVLIIILIRVLRGVLLLAIAIALILLTLYLSSVMFGIPFIIS